MMGHLKVPHALAGARIQADQTLSEESVAGPLTTEKIIGGRAEGQIDVTECLVRAHHRPDVGGACRFPGFLFPRFVAELPLCRHRAEEPSLLTGADIEAANVTGRHDLGHRNIMNLRPHHHDVAANDGWRGDAV
jgi:hypothetical protein